MSDKEATPIIIDVGKVKSKRVKQLKRGSGPLADEVLAAIQQSHGPNAVPVVVLYQERPKRKSKKLGLVPFLGI